MHMGYRMIILTQKFCYMFNPNKIHPWREEEMKAKSERVKIISIWLCAFISQR